MDLSVGVVLLTFIVGAYVWMRWEWIVSAFRMLFSRRFDFIDRSIHWMLGEESVDKWEDVEKVRTYPNTDCRRYVGETIDLVKGVDYHVIEDENECVDESC